MESGHRISKCGLSQVDHRVCQKLWRKDILGYISPQLEYVIDKVDLFQLLEVNSELPVPRRLVSTELLDDRDLFEYLYYKWPSGFKYFQTLVPASEKNQWLGKDVPRCVNWSYIVKYYPDVARCFRKMVMIVKRFYVIMDWYN